MLYWKIVIGFSLFVAVVGIAISILFAGKLENIPDFNWKDAVTLKYSFLRRS